MEKRFSKKEFQKRVKELCNKRGIDIDILCHKLLNKSDVYRSYEIIYNLLNTMGNDDYASMTLKYIEPIANYFNVSLDYLIYGDRIESNDATVRTVCSELNIYEGVFDKIKDISHPKYFDKNSKLTKLGFDIFWRLFDSVFFQRIGEYAVFSLKHNICFEAHAKYFSEQYPSNDKKRPIGSGFYYNNFGPSKAFKTEKEQNTARFDMEADYSSSLEFCGEYDSDLNYRCSLSEICEVLETNLRSLKYLIVSFDEDKVLLKKINDYYYKCISNKNTPEVFVNSEELKEESEICNYVPDIFATFLETPKKFIPKHIQFEYINKNDRYSKIKYVLFFLDDDTTSVTIDVEDKESESGKPRHVETKRDTDFLQPVITVVDYLYNTYSDSQKEYHFSKDKEPTIEVNLQIHHKISSLDLILNFKNYCPYLIRLFADLLYEEFFAKIESENVDCYSDWYDEKKTKWIPFPRIEFP